MTVVAECQRTGGGGRVFISAAAEYSYIAVALRGRREEFSIGEKISMLTLQSLQSSPRYLYGLSFEALRLPTDARTTGEKRMGRERRGLCLLRAEEVKTAEGNFLGVKAR